MFLAGVEPAISAGALASALDPRAGIRELAVTGAACPVRRRVCVGSVCPPASHRLGTPAAIPAQAPSLAGM